MKNNTLNGIPATVLETMAEHLIGQPEPVKIRSVEDHAALAAQALWAFACKTGLNRESESVETVVTDFWPTCFTCVNSVTRTETGQGVLTACCKQR